MLTTIQLRIARDILLMFAVSLFVLTLMVMFIGVAREAMNQGLGIAGVLRLIPYALPNALSIAVPGTALFSVCCVYGRMSADNEFTAMQSVGISPMPAIWPAIVITTLMSLGTVKLIDAAFTWGFHGAQHVVMSSVENIAYSVLQRDRSFQHGPLTLTVRDVDGKNLIEPVINIRRENDGPISINARRAELSYDDKVRGLTLRVTEGSATMGDKAAFHFPDTFVHTVPLDDCKPYDVLTANPSHMPMSDFATAGVKQLNAIHVRESAIAVHTGFNLMASRYDEIGGREAHTRSESLVSGRKRLKRLDTELHRRWASGFTCLALVLVGIPFAIRMRTADTMTTFGTVFLPTLLVYYPIFALTLDMAKEGRMPPSAVWIANAVFLAISLLLMRRNAYSRA